MKSLEEKIIEKIKSGDIHQHSQYYFTARNTLLWAIFYIITFFVSIALGIFFFITLNADWGLLEDTDLDLPSKAFHVIPILWLVTISVLILSAYMVFLHTKTGYRKYTKKLIAIFIFGILLFSTLLYLTDNAEKIEGTVSNIPYYENFVSTKRQDWLNANKGKIAGYVEKIQDENNLTIRDARNNIWNITLSPSTYADDTKIEIGTRIKIIGRQISNNQFEAIEIRPW